MVRFATWTDYMGSMNDQELYLAAIAEAKSYGEAGRELVTWLLNNPPQK